MALRRRLASLAVGLLLLGVTVLSAAPTASAGSDSICTTKPDLCGQLTLRLSGYVAGTAAADAYQATQVLSCHHDPSGTTTTCSGSFSTVGGSRVVNVAGFPDNPAGVTTCVASNCGTNGQNADVTVTAGGRASVNVSFNPTNGHSVTVTKGGSGTGTVTSDQGGISCGSVCTWTYFDSTLVVLTATATGGSTFAGWSDAGTCQGQDATCHLLTAVNVTTQALFNAPATPAPPTATAAPPTPTPSASSATKTPAPSAQTTQKPPTAAPGTPVPGSTDGVPSTDPSASGAAMTAGPDIGPTPTPFTFVTAAPISTGADPGGAGAGATSPPTGPVGAGAPGSPLVLIGLILALGGIVGGGVFWWARRRGSLPAG